MTSSLEALLMKSRLHQSETKSSKKSSKKEKETPKVAKYLVFSCTTPLTCYKDALAFLNTNPEPLEGIKYLDTDIKGSAARQDDAITYFEITRRIGNAPYLIATKPGMYSTIKFEQPEGTHVTSFVLLADLDNSKDINDCLISFVNTVDIISVHFYADTECEDDYRYESIHMKPDLLASWRRVKDVLDK